MFERSGHRFASRKSDKSNPTTVLPDKVWRGFPMEALSVAYATRSPDQAAHRLQTPNYEFSRAAAHQHGEEA